MIFCEFQGFRCAPPYPVGKKIEFGNLPVASPGDVPLIFFLQFFDVGFGFVPFGFQHLFPFVIDSKI